MKFLWSISIGDEDGDPEGSTHARFWAAVLGVFALALLVTVLALAAFLIIEVTGGR